MNLVARRELYTARFRRHIQNKEYDQAETLLETFRGLENRVDLARQLLLKFLDPRTSNQLADELFRAQRSG